MTISELPPPTEEWFVQPNDLIGGYCVMNVDKPPSQCDFRGPAGPGRDRVIADCGDEEDALEIVTSHNVLYGFW